MTVASGPIFVQSGTRVNGTAVTTITGSLPTLANSHGLLIARLALNSNAVVSTATSGWTKLFQDNSGVGLTQGIWIAPGNSAAPVFTWTGAGNTSVEIDFYDDPANPVETAVVGVNSTVGSGTSAAIASATNNSTRDSSVFVTITSMTTNTTLTASSGWAQNDLSNVSPFTLETSSKQITTSGSASGTTAQTAGTSTTWVQRQIELLLQVLPSGFYSTEIEVAPLMQIASGLEAAEVEVAPLMQIALGFEAAEVEVAPLMQIALGFEAAEVEIAVLTIPGVEPTPPVPATQIPKVRAWGFSLDQHDMYCLRLGDDTTLLFDLTTGKEVSWDSNARNVWRAHIGTNWTSVTSKTYASGLATNVIAGDDSLGVLWSLDPTKAVDDPDTIGNAVTPFTRIVTAGVPIRMRNSVRCDAVYLTVSNGQPFTGQEAITLNISDDNGATWQSQGTVVLIAGQYEQEVVWRSLGLMGAPGRIFEFVDTGGTVRIDSLDLKSEGLT